MWRLQVCGQFAVAMLCVAGALGQAPPAEIRGVVLEAGTNLPLPEAQVRVELETREAGSPPKFTEAGSTRTDLRGAFHFQIEKSGTYYVRVQKDGYTDDGRNPIRNSPSNQATVTVEKGAMAGELNFLLARPGSLSGRVVDEETGEALKGFRVQVMALIYANGREVFTGGGAPLTDEDGRFAVSGLRPGNYIVNIVPQRLVPEQLMERFSDEDLTATDSDYQRSYWPGGGGLDLALPVQVAAGGSASVGSIKARKAPFYRVHVTIPAGGCVAGEKLMISATTRQFSGADNGGEVVCGKSYLLRYFQPATYQVYFVGKSPENRKRAVLPLEVTNKNLELSVPLARGVDIDGHVIVADGVSARPAMEKIRLTLRTDGDLQFADEGRPAVPDAEGRFQFANRPVARAQLSVGGLPASYCVREIRYNGGSVPDGIITLNANAMAHSLEIVVDDKPASIMGTALDGDAPVSKAQIVLVRWPASREGVFLSVKRATGDAKGKFQFTSLAPGEYRILAVAEAAAEKLDEPRVLERLLRSATRVELNASATESLSLKVVDPLR